jgi:hypothetical protein
MIAVSERSCITIRSLDSTIDRDEVVGHPAHPRFQTT